MKMSVSIQIVANCKKYNKDAATLSEGESVDIPLDLAEVDMFCFLFKFTSNTFNVGDFKVSTSYKDNKPLIAFFKDDDIYVVIDPNKFLSEILEGYERIRFSSRLNNLLDIERSYWVADADENEEPVDEFDIEDDEPFVPDDTQEVVETEDEFYEDEIPEEVTEAESNNDDTIKAEAHKEPKEKIFTESEKRYMYGVFSKDNISHFSDSSYSLINDVMTC